MRNLIQSLSTQLALIISLALSVLTVLSGVLIERHLARAIEQQELDNLDQQASVLMSTLMTLMMDGNGTLARDWLENLHGASGLVEAEVLGNDGQIAFRDTGTLQKVNAYLGHDRFTRKAESLHFSLNWVTTDSITQALAGEKVYQYSNDKRVLSIVLPILQQNECKTCHGYDTASLRGALLVSVSTDAANARIADMQHTLWILAIVLVLMLGILLWIVLRTGVLQPIARLRDGILRVAKGDRNVVLAAIRADELGDLARQFNHMQSALAHSEARIRAVMDNVADGIVITDATGKIESLNPAAGRLLEYAPNELLGKNLNSVISSIDEDEYTDIISRYQQTNNLQEAFICEVVGVRKTGDKFPMEIKMSRMSVGEQYHVVAILRDITSQKEETAALQFRAMHDPLTGIPNRTLFFDRLDQAISQASRKSTPFALIILDLDRFKHINDSQGHHVGDEVLRQISHRIQGLLRKSDTVARLGGDEFAIIQPGMDITNATHIASKILQSLDQPVVVEGKPLMVGVSIGIALFPLHGKERAMLMRHADAAMYHAKRTGSGFVLYSPERKDYEV